MRSGWHSGNITMINNYIIEVDCAVLQSTNLSVFWFNVPSKAMVGTRANSVFKKLLVVPPVISNSDTVLSSEKLAFILWFIFLSKSAMTEIDYHWVDPSIISSFDGLVFSDQQLKSNKPTCM